MPKLITNVVFLVAILCIGFQGVLSCSISFTHPQMHYCNADYVIKVMVKSKQLVMLHGDGSFSKPQGPSAPVNPTEDDDEEGRNLPVAVIPNGEEELSTVSNESNLSASNTTSGEDLEGNAAHEQPSDTEAEAAGAVDAGREINRPGTGTSESDQSLGNNGGAEVSNEQPVEENEANLAPTDGNQIIWPGVQAGVPVDASNSNDINSPITTSNSSVGGEETQTNETIPDHKGSSVEAIQPNEDEAEAAPDSEGEEIIRPNLKIISGHHPAETKPDPAPNGENNSIVSQEQPVDTNNAGPAPTDGRLISWPGIRTSRDAEKSNNALRNSSENTDESEANNNNAEEAGPLNPLDGSSSTNSPILGRENARIPNSPGSLTLSSDQNDDLMGSINENEESRSNDSYLEALRKATRNFARQLERAFLAEIATNEKKQKSVETIDHEEFAEASLTPRRKRDAPWPVPPGYTAPSSDEPTSTLKMQYTVYVVKVSKGNVTEKTVNYVYSPPNEAVCGVRMEKKKRYIIMGNFQNNKLSVTLGDSFIDLSLLSTNEERHLARNLKSYYKKGCASCDIQVCWGCTDESNSKKCVWRNPYTTIKPRASQFACLKKKNGVCRWMNSSNPRMTPADLN